MAWKPRKVAIVGMGLVGSNCAYAIINQSVCEELMLINRTPDYRIGSSIRPVSLYGLHSIADQGICGQFRSMWGCRCSDSDTWGKHEQKSEPS
ncbi:hypothetical protein QFZ78_006575 [Paenibacillus sp. V4I5]|nr:hypothetical protein [Paenibacillus sp. V4I5]